MFRKHLLAAFAWLLLSLGAASSANLPLITGPIDPSNQIANFNQVIQNINSGVTGNVFEIITPVTTSGTSINTFGTLTLTPNFFTAVGQGIRVHAWGTNNSSTNAVTFTFSFGASTLTQTLTGATNTWDVTCTVLTSLLGATGGQVSECHGQTGTTLVASTQATNWAIPTSAAITVLLEGTVATSGTTTLNGATIEQIK